MCYEGSYGVCTSRVGFRGLTSHNTPLLIRTVVPVRIRTSAFPDVQGNRILKVTTIFDLEFAFLVEVIISILQSQRFRMAVRVCSRYRIRTEDYNWDHDCECFPDRRFSRKVNKNLPLVILKSIAVSLLGRATYDCSHRHRNDGSSPIHRSHYNPEDKGLIISARVKPTNGPARTHHIYANGTGTIGVGDKREYSTSATQGGPVDMAAEEGPRE